MKRQIIFSLIGLFLISCNQEKAKHPMVGLWEITKVTIDGEENTPQGKWMRFNADSTQESGNGWLQHSRGTWKLDAATNELFLYQANGWKDEFENFKVAFAGEDMTWSRTEEGQKVDVFMKRVEKIPQRQADELYGVWQLYSTTIDSIQMKAIDKTTIFFRWDKMFVAQDEQNRSFGIFKTGSHKQEVEMVYYNPECTREYWDYSVKNNILKLEAKNSEKKTIQTYQRIYELN